MIYITYPNCTPDIMILAQAVLQIFCSQGCFTTQNDKVGKAYIDKSKKTSKRDKTLQCKA